MTGKQSTPRRREAGFASLFVLALAASVFLALSAALQANRSLRDLNKRQADEIQARANTLRLR